MKQNNMIDCTITSPAETTIYKNVRSVTLPAFAGQMQILPGHAESFILLQNGDISLQQLNKQSKTIQITSGECHIKDDAMAIIL